MKKTLVAGMLILGLVAVGCDDGDDATEAPAAVEEQSVDDAVEENAEDAADELEDKADEKEEELRDAG